MAQLLWWWAMLQAKSLPTVHLSNRKGIDINKSCWHTWDDADFVVVHHPFDHRLVILAACTMQYTGSFYRAKHSSCAICKKPVVRQQCMHAYGDACKQEEQAAMTLERRGQARRAVHLAAAWPTHILHRRRRRPRSASPAGSAHPSVPACAVSQVPTHPSSLHVP